MPPASEPDDAGSGARARGRWPALREAAERLHAALRPRFVFSLLLLGGVSASVAIGVAWLTH